MKEDQIRQEMEIVKKSLEESKAAPQVNIDSKATPGLDLAQAFSSASDLLAFLQNTMQSTSATNPTSSSTADVVASNTQPRSFGDPPEPAKSFPEAPRTLIQPSPQISAISSQGSQSNNRQALLQTPNLANYDGQNQDNYNRGGWNAPPMNHMTGDNRMAYSDNNMANNIDNRMPDNRRMMGDNRGPMQHRQFSQPPRYDNYNQNQYNNPGPRGNFMNGGNNFENRPDTNNQYANNSSNYGNVKHFRGRGGRGHRGRGRGGYY